MGMLYGVLYTYDFINMSQDVNWQVTADNLAKWALRQSQLAASVVEEETRSARLGEVVAAFLPTNAPIYPSSLNIHQRRERADGTVPGDDFSEDSSKASSESEPESESSDDQGVSCVP